MLDIKEKGSFDRINLIDRQIPKFLENPLIATKAGSKQKT